MGEVQSAKETLTRVSADTEAQRKLDLQIAQEWLALIAESSKKTGDSDMLGPFQISGKIIAISGWGEMVPVGIERQINFEGTSEPGCEYVGYEVRAVIPDPAAKGYELPEPSVTFTKIETVKRSPEEVRKDYLSGGSFTSYRSERKSVGPQEFIEEMKKAAERWREEGKASSSSTGEALSKAGSIISSVK